MLRFLGIGAQKSGTTWLYYNLIRHPDIRLTPEKELHFWDQKRDRGLDWYRAQFAGFAGHMAGEITPAYAILKPEQIAEIRAEFPDLRLIYLMRNPVERAWSGALMALRNAEMRFEEASDRWFLDHFLSAGSQKRSDYEACLRNWHGAYPKESLLVARFDDIVADPRSLLTRCAIHLGIDPKGFDAVTDDEIRRAVFEGSGHPIRPQLKNWLVRYYEPKIRSLEAYLGLDLSAWHAQNATGRGGLLTRLKTAFR